ncbi:MAG: protein kinase [Sandaracinus sp.]
MAERDDHTLDATHAGQDLRSGSTDLAPGDVFADRYLVELLVGRGGMGTVYRVRDTMVDELVALKILGQTSAEVVERFRREVRLARRITSPHVARTHDLGTHAGVHYLTMELVEGVSLGRKLEEGPFTPARAAHVAAAIARGLAAAHAASVVHRDLKPDNVLLEAKSGRVVVTDFGIARALDFERVRATGGIAGTPAYMAPEQLTGAAVDGRADLYALGVVLFEMLTGALPFEGDTPISIAVARLHHAPRDLATLRVVPAELAQIVHTLLAREPDRRFASADEVAQKLEALAATLDRGVTPSPISMPESSTFARMVTPHTPSTGSGSRRVIAVAPIAYRGSPEHGHLPDGMTSELVDLLSRTRNVSVIGRSAVQNAFAHASDPRVSAKELGATHLLDATLQGAPTKLRLTARLVDVTSGMQVWTHKEELDPNEDPFGLEERFARRTAEALRLGLEGLVGTERISGEALELFLAARRSARSPSVTDRASAVAMLEQVITLAPSFAPALAIHAIACVRAWVLPRTGAEPADARDWRAEATESVRRALERAPHVPETHHAAAVVHLQAGEYRDAIRHARAALALAPAYPDAHLVLGSLKLEAGRAKEGLESIEIALDIDPTLEAGHYERARYHALYGDPALADTYGKKLLELSQLVLWAQIEIRAGAWRGEPDRLRRGLEALSRSPHPLAGPLSTYARAVLREIQPPPGFGPTSTTFAASPRVRSVAMQMQAEALGSIGDVDAAAQCVELAATTVLVDLDWIDRCPVIAAVRADPRFPEWRRAVARRSEEVWSS